MTIIATIIVLGVLIFVHELGHFWAAKSVDVRVERFSIGLGPRVWGVQRGETEYVLSAIPLGGYVKMGGMDDEVMESIEGGPTEEGEEDPAVPARPPRDRSRDFDAKPVWARAWVISAGVIMNMLFAFGAYTAVAAGWGSVERDTTRVGEVRAELLPAGAEALQEIPRGAVLVRIGERTPAHWGEVRSAFLELPPGPVSVVFAEPEGEVVVELPSEAAAREALVRGLDFWAEAAVGMVHPGSPADRAGLRAGDRVLAVDGEEVRLWSEFTRLIRARPEQETTLTIVRDGGTMTRTVVPQEVRGQDPVTGETVTIGQIGLLPDLPGVAYSPLAFGDAVVYGARQTWGITVFILDFLKDLLTGQVSARNLGSILTIGEASGQAAAEGLPVFLSFMALFSINLAILNLLPIPVLDGGHLVFLAIEAVRGRPVSMEQRMRWSQVGFVVLIGIMVLALGNDFLRIFGL